MSANAPKVTVIPDETWPVAAGFWEAAARDELAFPRCRQCGLFAWYPLSHCPNCRTKSFDWHAIEPYGRINSFTVIRRAFLADYEENLPHAVLRVQFDSAPGVTLICALYDRDQLDELRVDAPVRIRFNRVTAGVNLPLGEIVGGAV